MKKLLKELTIHRRVFSKREPYHHVRFTWSNAVNVKAVAETLKETFEIGKLTTWYNALYQQERIEVVVKADTLRAMISAFTAVLYQRERAPFTELDMELRKTLFKLYPWERPTPYPWSFTWEPKFEVATR